MDEADSTPLTTLSRTLEAASDETWAAQLADELLALSSIYDEESITLLPLSHSVTPVQASHTGASRLSTPSASGSANKDLQLALARSWTPGAILRLSFKTQLEPSASSLTSEPLDLLTAVTLPERYPASEHPPQLQLLNRFVGGHPVDHIVFGKVLRCFLHDSKVLVEKGRAAGLEWKQGESILFEALEWVKESLSEWYDAKEQELQMRTVHMDAEREAKVFVKQQETLKANRHVTEFGHESSDTSQRSHQDLEALAKKLKLISAEPITDRKSTFIGHCCHLTDPAQVPLIIEHLLSDKRIARAAHPKIHAWTCSGPNGVMQRDCDDDGETTAGGRLAHLLQILNVENVLVVVTRWFGGIHLGPNRFKHINRAARDALEAGGFVADGTSTNV
ncbi:ribosomal protein S5 domain 2-like protein [Tilletiaria anomala UBC 951]|uniref:Ribosomal protein S5 domain 2-like protein n=1 Tax=Tilletiaria anomala (strain ATCC 24038 / CBS 436.72 / UBC 951) TaxID=1037660 RepID=A0A066WE90_TILAU|nr:ribosomal protein S5 domain 2-like protein [Tilletiaria anomala UBC 951]KDN52272.1 ribosomal protein S5 domain 2-like protein [Tilletiaria anomala UBC 951]